MVLTLAYVGWTFIGYIVTDEFALYFFDHLQVGWEVVITSIAGFVAAGQAGRYSPTRKLGYITDQYSLPYSLLYNQHPRGHVRKDG
jgi:hypothetical protein